MGYGRFIKYIVAVRQLSMTEQRTKAMNQKQHAEVMSSDLQLFGSEFGVQHGTSWACDKSLTRGLSIPDTDYG